MQDKKQQLEPDMEKWTGSKLRKKYIQAVYCDPAKCRVDDSQTGKFLKRWEQQTT